jgi:hypothetical protein
VFDLPAMRLVLVLAIFGVLFGAGFLSAVAVDESMPYGLVCVAVMHSDGNEEWPLGDGPPPRPGDLVTVHVDANEQGEVLVVALGRKTSQLAHGWRPLIAPVKSWDEIGLPPRGEQWVWVEATEPFEVFVAFIAKDDPAATVARQLVTQMRDPATNAVTLNGLSRLLREEFQKWQEQRTSLATTPATAPASLAGTLRTAGGFSWRPHAWKANFSAGQPAVLVFRNAAAR